MKLFATGPQTIFISILILVSSVNAAEEAAKEPKVSTTKETKLFIATEDYPPFNMRDDITNEITGVSTDIVRALMKAAKISYRIDLYPWNRAIKMAYEDHNHCVYSMSRTPERESKYKWIGPLVNNEWSLFAKKMEKSTPPNSLDEVRGQTIGTYQGDAIEAYLIEKKHAVETTTKDTLNPEKLLAGRIAFWATGKLIGLAQLKRMKINNIEPVLTFNRSVMYLACQKNLDNALFEKLNTLVTKMQRSDQITHIYKKWGYTP